MNNKIKELKNLQNNLSKQNITTEFSEKEEIIKKTEENELLIKKTKINEKNQIKIISELEWKLNQKNEEIQNLIHKNADLEKQLRKINKEIILLNESYEKSIYEYKYEINKKNEEIHLLKINYDKMIRELQFKLEKVFI